MKRFFLWMLAGILFFTGCKKSEKPKSVVTENGDEIVCVATEEALRVAIDMSRAETGSRKIRIEDGVLVLSAPIILDERDRELVLRGSGKTVISGGIEVAFYEVEGESYWTAKLPENAPEPYLLWIPGSGKRERAVFPKNGWLKNLDHSDLVWLGRQAGGWDRPPTQYELTRMSVTPDDLPDFEPDNADVEVSHGGTASLVHICKYDPNLWEMSFAEPLTHPAGASEHRKYRIHNIEPGMGPGKWRFHRATREIYYHPQGGESITDFRAVAASADSLLQIKNGQKITVENLEFRCANADLRRRGALPGVSAGRALPAVEIVKSSDIWFSDVTLCSVAGTAIELSGSDKVTLAKCRIQDAGAFGVYAFDASDLAVCECSFSQIGQVAIRVTGKKCRLDKNEISRVGGNGIVAAGDVEICGNRIRQTLETRENGAAIYLDGGKNAKIAGNRIEELSTSGGRYAIYLDETTEHAEISGNTVESFFPVLVNCARDVMIRDNTFTSKNAMTFDLVNSDRVTLKNNVIQAPKIVFSAPENALKREDNRHSGAVETHLKKRGFYFFYDREKVLRCKLEQREVPLDPLKWKRIVCMGDSITAAGPMVYELQLYLSCRYPNRRIEVFNAGVSGDTAACGWERLPQVLALKPDAVILCYGMNDVGRADYGELWPESVDQAKRRRYGIESYKKNLKKIISFLQEKKIDVILLPPFPYDEYGTRSAPDVNYRFCNSVGLEKLALFCHTEYDRKLPMPMTRTALCRLYAHYPELCIAKDRVHPDLRGHWLIADEIVRELFDRFPAEDPLPFPLTEKMVEFSHLPPVPGVAKDAQLHPLQYLGQGGAVDAPTQVLRQKMAKIAAVEGILNTMDWFDLQARSRGIDPEDHESVDARLRPLAAKWGMPKTYENYRKWRTERAELADAAQRARIDYFQTVENLQREKKAEK